KVLPLGASNLYSAIKGISAKIENKTGRLILVSDAVPTAGIIEKTKIAELIKSQTWISRLDVLVPGTYKDPGIIKKIVPLGKNAGTSIDLGDDIEEILNKLERKVYTENKISIPGAKWYYPDQIDSIQSGDPVVVFGELKEANTNPSKEIKFNGNSIENFTSLTMDELLLEREAMAARINRLIENSEKEQNEDTAKGLELQAKELSIKHRIQCQYTSFLVLETEADYARFQITRNSLTNILTIGVGGLEVINRRNSKLYEFLDEEKIEEAKRAKQEADRLAKNDLKKKGKKKNGNISANGASDGFTSADESSSSFKDMDDEISPKKMSEAPSSSIQNEKADKSTIADNKPSPPPATKTEEAKKELSLDKPRPIPAKDISPQIEIPERERRKLESIRRPPPQPRPEPAEKREKVEPYTGNMKKFYSLLSKKEFKKAEQFALDWRTKSADDALAIVALGDAYEKQGNKNEAVRAYTSLIDYFPKRADIRRWAGEKLMSIGEYDDSIDTLKHALDQRPDHPSSYHLLAIAYIKDKQYKSAATIALKGINFQFDGRFGSVHDILYDDLDLAYSLAMKTDSKDREYFNKIKTEYKVKQLTKEIRFILVWETDANDVDFHIYDKEGNHAFYSSKQLSTGGELYADLTGGYGPECFRILNPYAFPYKLEAHYYSRGPMGYGMGAVQIIRYDGEKDLEVETRDYVIMNDGAFLDLGTVKE
ncbi:MAG TPA: tetratricopeptide repeat protein, partial [Leptospiraceae bacterium]|nr:tetratricopeptide repeat protein [Leptospiraceae bacterium]